jgi:vancomycin resistance protein YoaR
MRILLRTTVLGNVRFVILGFMLLLLPSLADAAFAPLTYRHQHHLFTIDPDDYPLWQSSTEVWMYNEKEVLPPSLFRVDGDESFSIPEGFSKSSRYTWNRGAIRSTIVEKISQYLDRPAGSVVIGTGLDGTITFDGVGLLGRRVVLQDAVQLTMDAIIQGVTDILLPVEEIQPTFTVKDSTLKAQGILEVLAVGESDFRGSPANREHNISVGLHRFNGHRIPQGANFSFNEVLGPVNATAGYRQELVIKGDKTLPDYGGGLCQVSTTAYRGIWEYGFPINQRTNHSYSVRYYFPQGTDATIYPPYKDVQFTNNSPGDILIQTHMEDGKAYFLYYGTRDARESTVVGPFVWGQTSVPADRVEYTTDIPPGSTRKVGERVPGVNAAWFRLLNNTIEDQFAIEPYYSSYEARPQYTQIGVETVWGIEGIEEMQEMQEIEEIEEKQKAVLPVRRWVERIRRRD